jgi:hypothetical protein
MSSSIYVQKVQIQRPTSSCHLDLERSERKSKYLLPRQCLLEVRPASRLVPTRDIDDVELRQTLTLINMMVVGLVINLLECGGSKTNVVDTEWNGERITGRVSYLIINHDESRHVTFLLCTSSALHLSGSLLEQVMSTKGHRLSYDHETVTRNEAA